MRACHLDCGTLHIELVEESERSHELDFSVGDVYSPLNTDNMYDHILVET